jgi:hypothetical protein
MTTLGLDFGGGAEELKPFTSTGLTGECDPISHELNRCRDPNKVDDQSIFKAHVAQREWINPTSPKTYVNASSAGNIPSLQNELKRHLETVPCLIIHFGSPQTDFSAIRLFCQHLVAEHPNGDLPIMFCAASIQGADVIKVEQIPEMLTIGISIVYNAISNEDLRLLGIQMGQCAKIAREKHLDISEIRVILVIDKAASLILGKTIRDDADDRDYVVDHSNKEYIDVCKKNKFELATKYLPQVEILGETSSSMMMKEWATKMTKHQFRNAHFLPTAIERAKWPLDQLSFLLSYHPFGMSFVLADMLLPENGQMVKRLLESWVNTFLGNPIRFIQAE